MTWWIQLLLLLGGLAIVGTAYHEFEDTHYVQPAYKAGAAAQKTEDQKAVNQLSSDLLAAQKQAADSQLDFDKCHATVDKQNDALRILKATSDGNDAKYRKAVAAGAATATSAAQQLAAYDALMKRQAATGQTCQQELAGVRKMLVDTLHRESGKAVTP